MMKKMIFGFLSLFFFLSAMTCNIDPVAVPVTDVTLSPVALTLTPNGTQQLTPTVIPADATNKNVTYSSSNAATATVSATGLITAKAAGTATITVKTNNGNFTATCTVTVVNAMMTTAINGNFAFAVQGSGSITVDWGDGTSSGSLTVPCSPSKTYTNGTSRTITINGGNGITALQCGNYGLTSLYVSGLTTITSIDVSVGILSKTAIDNLFISLPTVATGTIWVNNNDGSDTCNTTIATSKGWTVIK